MAQGIARPVPECWELGGTLFEYCDSDPHAVPWFKRECKRIVIAWLSKSWMTNRVTDLIVNERERSRIWLNAGTTRVRIRIRTRTACRWDWIPKYRSLNINPYFLCYQLRNPYQCNNQCSAMTMIDLMNPFDLQVMSPTLTLNYITIPNTISEHCNEWMWAA